MDTPEFLVWSLGFACPLREFLPPDQPEKVERHLRSARAFGDARIENRIFEGLAVEPPLAFHPEQALAIYGGQAAVEAACYGCPANALATLDPSSLAGCFGMWPLPEDAREFQVAVDRVIAELGLEQQCRSLFAPASPHWYAFWQKSPLTNEQVALLGMILASLATDNTACQRGMNEFRLALRTALEQRLVLHFQHYSRGEVAGNWWHLGPHCPRCHSQWPASVRHCSTCDYSGQPAQPPKRRSRGTRPYFPLMRLLGADQAAQFLTRYEAARHSG